MSQRLILGIDPGYGRCGVALLDASSPTPTLKQQGLITTKPGLAFPLRLQEIASDFQLILKKWQPNLVVIEDLFWARNVDTALQVAQVRGVFVYLTQESGISLLEPHPNDVKKAFTGNGRASKGEMARMAQHLWSLPKGIKDDTIDAMAVAWWGSTQSTFPT